MPKLKQNHPQEGKSDFKKKSKLKKLNTTFRFVKSHRNDLLRGSTVTGGGLSPLVDSYDRNFRVSCSLMARERSAESILCKNYKMVI